MNKHNPVIDFYRIIFSLVIVSGHACFLQGRIEGDYTHYVPFLGGYTAVEFFFLLSGYFLAQKAYCMSDTTRNAVRKKTWNEITKKIKSLYPAILCSYFLSVGLCYHFNGGNILTYFKSSIGELLLLKAAGFVFPGYMNFLAAIWFFSALLIGILILFPLMARYKEYFSTIIAPLIVILGYGYFARINGNITAAVDPASVISGDLLRSCFALSLGNIVYYVTSNTSSVFRTWKKAVKILEIIIFLSLLYFMNEYSSDYHDFIETMLFAVLIFCTFKTEHSEKIFHNRCIQFFGKYSSTLYAVHFSLIWIPENVWPKTWAEEYAMWMAVTNILSLTVHILVHIVIHNILPCLLPKIKAICKS